MARGDIRQKISLDGGEEVRRQLALIGASGEKALRDLTVATTVSSASLGQFTQLSTTMSMAFRGAGNELAPLRAGFTDLGTAVSGTLQPLGGMTKALVALALPLSVAGLFELARSAVAAEQALSLNARQLGVSVDQFRAYGKAAQRAGVDADEFTSAASRFNVNTQKILEDQSKSIIGLTQELVGKTASAGVQVLGRTGETSARIVTSIGDNFKASSEFATRAMETINQSGKKVNLTFEQLRGLSVNALNQGGEAAQKFATELNKLGINAPSKTVFGQLEKAVPGFTDELTKMGIALTKSGGEARTFAEIFPEFLDGFSKLKSTQEQSRIVQELWGRGALSLINFFKQGRSALKDFPEVFKAVGINAADSGKDIDFLQGAFLALSSSIERVKKTVGLAFAEVLQPAITAFTSMIQSNQTALKAWATGMATQVKPAVEDIVTLIGNLGRTMEEQQPLHTEFGKGLVSTFGALKDVLRGVAAAFRTLSAAVDVVLTPINKIFGTELTGGVVLATGLVLKFVGAFALLGGIVTLMQGLGIAIAGILGIPLFTVALIAGLTALTATLLIHTDAWKNFKGIVEATGGILQSVGTIVARAARGDFAALKQIASDIGSGKFADAVGAKNAVAGPVGETKNAVAGSADETKAAVAETKNAVAVLRGSAGETKNAVSVLRGSVGETKNAVTVMRGAVGEATQALGTLEETMRAATAAKALTATATPPAPVSTGTSDSGLTGNVSALQQAITAARQFTEAITASGAAIAQGDFAGFRRELGEIGKIDFSGLQSAFIQLPPGIQQAVDGIKAAFSGSAKRTADELRAEFAAASVDTAKLIDFSALRAALADLPGFAKQAVDGVKAAWADTATLVDLSAIGVAAQTAWTAVGAATTAGMEIIKAALAEFTIWLTNQTQAFWAAITAAATAVDQNIRSVFGGLSSWVTETLGPALSGIWDAFKSAATQAFSKITGLFDRLIDLARSVATAVGNAFSSAPESLANPVGGMATGGLVRGPGTGTSDSILARLSNREYVINARAVRFWGPDVFEALNRLRTPQFSQGGIVARPAWPSLAPPRFAAGGLVAVPPAEQSSPLVNLHLIIKMAKTGFAAIASAFGGARDSEIGQGLGRDISAVSARQREPSSTTRLAVAPAVLSQPLSHFQNDSHGPVLAMIDRAIVAFSSLVAAAAKVWASASAGVVAHTRHITSVAYHHWSSVINNALAPTGARGAGSAVFNRSSSAEGMVRGGYISGPGTGTSDSVPIWASAGEHITKTKAVDYYSPRFFDLLNRMAIPREQLFAALGGMRGFSLGGMVDSARGAAPVLQMPRFALGGLVDSFGGLMEGLSRPLMPRQRFAGGGLVAAPAGGGGMGTPVHFHFPGGESFGPMVTDERIAEGLGRLARRSKLLSAGRRPGHAGS